MRACYSGRGNFSNSHSLWLIEEQIDDVVSAFGVVKEDKQRPVYEPHPLLQRLKRRTHRLNRGRKEKQGLITNVNTASVLLMSRC